MTEQNALRYYIVRARRLLQYDKSNYQRAINLYNESKDCLDIVGCNSCDFDDIGYCYFRGSEVHGSSSGYSGYTITGFDIDTLKFSEYALGKLLDSHKFEYCHLVLSI